jgi:hypothetical protein
VSSVVNFLFKSPQLHGPILAHDVGLPHPHTNISLAALLKFFFSLESLLP